MDLFFTTKDPLEQIIHKTLPDKHIKSTQHILTGWTNIVIEATTTDGNFFFRFPRNPFWSKMIIKDAAVCNFIQGKTSFYTPSMKLCYDQHHRPFSVHPKIEGYSLTDRIYHLSHNALAASAYDIAKFIKELSSLDLKDALPIVKYPLSQFLQELDYNHYEQHLDDDHRFIKQTEHQNQLVHGDLNLGNVLLNQDNQVIGFIDFCFAGTGNPNMDVSRIISRPVPKTFEATLLSEFENPSEIRQMQKIWQDIDNGYLNHIKKHFPEITV